MSKTISSPVKEFPGTVKLPSYLTMPQALAYEQALRDGSVLIEEKASQTEFDAVMLKVIFQCVEEWNLDGYEQLSEETFPATPRGASSELILWLFEEIMKLYSPDIPE